MDSDNPFPSWLDNNFLTSILQKEDLSNNIKVLSFSVKPAVTEGNNYCCDVYRVHIEYQTNCKPKRTSLIVKTPRQSGETKIILEASGIITKECTIYNEIFPIMNKLINNEIAVKSYVNSIPGTLIFEDLNEQGYIMCNKLEKLDFEHCNSFMKKIGTFHALSIYIYKQEPELIKKVGTDYFYSENGFPESKVFHSTGLKLFSSVLKEWEGYENFAKFITNNIDNLWESIVTIHTDKKHLRVLNHGDTWVNNMLFKYDNEGKVIDIKLIDFQMCKFASPAMDLITFIVSSAQEEVKQHRLDELYNTYIESLNSTLETIGCDERLSLEQLQDELDFAKSLTLSILPHYISIIQSEKHMDMDELLNAWKNYKEDDKGPLWEQLNGKVYKKTAQYTLKKLEEEGFLLSF